MQIASKSLKRILDVARTVITNSPLRINQMIHLKGENGLLTATGTNTEVFVSCTTEFDGTLDICIPQEIIRYLSSVIGDVEIKIKGKRLQLNGFKCEIEPGADFMKLPLFTRARAITVDGIVDVMKKVTKVTASDSGSYYSGVLFHDNHVYGGDGNNMIKVGFEHPFSNTLITNATSSLIPKIVGETCDVYMENNLFVLESGDITIHGRLWDFNYPVDRLNKILDSVPHGIDIDVPMFTSTLKRAMSADGAMFVKLDSDGNELTMNVEGMYSSIEEKMPMSGSIDQVAYNGKNLLNIFSLAPANSNVSFKHPLVIRGDNFTAFSPKILLP